jgi:hypothetical protein
MKKILTTISVSLLLIISLEVVFNLSGTYSPVLSYLVKNGGIQSWWSGLIVALHDGVIVLALFLAALLGLRKLAPEIMTWKSILIMQAPVSVFIFLQNILPFEIKILTPYTVSGLTTSFVMMFGLLGLYLLIKNSNSPREF